MGKENDKEKSEKYAFLLAGADPLAVSACRKSVQCKGVGGEPGSRKDHGG